MKNRYHTGRWVGILVTIAALIVTFAPRAALAQYRVENYDGHVLDASNRIGSGGYNNGGPVNNQVNAEDLYLGNVTGYGAFKGTVPDRDPAGFQGFIPYQPSLLLNQQAGVTSPTAPPTYGRSTPYYNAYNVASAPIQVQQIPGTISYIPATPAYQATQDYRLGATQNTPTPTQPKIGEIVGPGAVDPTASMTPTYLNSAPLAGLSPLNQPPGAAYIQPGTSGLGVTPGQANGLASGLSQRDLERLRGEMAQSQLSPAAASRLGSGAIANLVGNQKGQGGTTPGANPSGISAPPGAPAPPGSPISGQLPPSQVQGAIGAPIGGVAQNSAISPGANNFATGQAERSSLALPPAPTEQSPQYEKLRELLQQYQASHPKTDEEANRQFQAALKARRDYEQSLAHPAPAAKPAENPAPQPTLGTPPETVPPPAPLPVGPIGQTMRAPGLSQLLQQGEDLSRHQRYKEAIGKFMDARQVAPNETLIEMDLANAELGAGFYAQAEQSLRDAFTADPATQMGKYDLKSVIGDERLQVLIEDLKQLSKNGDSATPVFLLAYLSYNTGDTDKAVGYLHLAQSRAGGSDELIRSLGEHWTLPATLPSK